MDVAILNLLSDLVGLSVTISAVAWLCWMMYYTVGKSTLGEAALQGKIQATRNVIYDVPGEGVTLVSNRMILYQLVAGQRRKNEA